MFVVHVRMFPLVLGASRCNTFRGREGERKAAENQKDQSDGAESLAKRERCRPAKYLGEERKKPSFELQREREGHKGRAEWITPGGHSQDVSLGSTLVTFCSPASAFLSKQYM